MCINGMQRRALQLVYKRKDRMLFEKDHENCLVGRNLIYFLLCWKFISFGFEDQHDYEIVFIMNLSTFSMCN